MIRRPPRSTRTYTLFPYTTLFRSSGCSHDEPLRISYQIRFTRRFPALGGPGRRGDRPQQGRSEEHTSELQSLMRISYAVFCLKKKKKTKYITNSTTNKRSTSTYKYV